MLKARDMATTKTNPEILQRRKPEAIVMENVLSPSPKNTRMYVAVCTDEICGFTTMLASHAVIAINCTVRIGDLKAR
jgi:hypothetical protein